MGGIPKKLVELILDRDGGQCVVAGPHCTGRGEVAHHRANRGMGGSKLLNDPRNLVACCGLDNGWVEDAHGQELAGLIDAGHRVRKGATNAKTLAATASKPVRYPDGSWWFLLADGTRQVSSDPGF